MISDKHKALNVELHQRDPGFGGGGYKWAKHIHLLARQQRCDTILDYGCGKGTLRPAMLTLNPGLIVREYDPGIPGKDATPLPAELVVCTDVLEHVEPEQLDAVIQHVCDLTLKLALVAVACRPGKRGLADGRDEHLIVESQHWWALRLAPFGFYEFPSLRRDRKEYAAVWKRP